MFAKSVLTVLNVAATVLNKNRGEINPMSNKVLHMDKQDQGPDTAVSFIVGQSANYYSNLLALEAPHISGEEKQTLIQELMDYGDKQSNEIACFWFTDAEPILPLPSEITQNNRPNKTEDNKLAKTYSVEVIRRYYIREEVSVQAETEEEAEAEAIKQTSDLPHIKRAREMDELQFEDVDTEATEYEQEQVYEHIRYRHLDKLGGKEDNENI